MVVSGNEPLNALPTFSATANRCWSSRQSCGWMATLTVEYGGVYWALCLVQRLVLKPLGVQRLEPKYAVHIFWLPVVDQKSASINRHSSLAAARWLVAATFPDHWVEAYLLSTGFNCFTSPERLEIQKFTCPRLILRWTPQLAFGHTKVDSPRLNLESDVMNGCEEIEWWRMMLSWMSGRMDGCLWDGDGLLNKTAHHTFSTLSPGALCMCLCCACWIV